MNTELYESDYYLWIQDTVEKLKVQDYDQVDWTNLLDEIEALGRGERRILRANLVAILLFKLRWQYQPDQRLNSWKATVSERRRQIRELLEDSPSLKQHLQEVFQQCYQNAVEQASAVTGISVRGFHSKCPYSLPEVLEQDLLDCDR